MSEKEDLKFEQKIEEAALSWLSLVSRQKTDNIVVKRYLKPRRYEARRSHRDKRGWDRFLCSL